MEAIERQIEVGDWVEVIDHGLLTGCKGFVLKFERELNHCKVQIILNKNGGRILVKPWLNKEQVIPSIETNNPQDLFTLIDMALDCNDEQWFNELTGKLAFKKGV